MLTRSFFVGSQKYGAYWTGDNRCLYSEIKGAMTMLLQVGNAGNIFGGADLPCFYGMPTEDMWIMLYQLGMYYPFMRAHTNEFYLDREPWLQTQRVQNVIRDVMHRRYDLIHYIYSTFEFGTHTGHPLMRPMWMEFPDQAEFLDVDTQFMLGRSFLVAPKITEPDAILADMHRQPVKYLLPKGEYWYNYISKQKNTVTGEWQE